MAPGVSRHNQGRKEYLECNVSLTFTCSSPLVSSSVLEFKICHESLCNLDLGGGEHQITRAFEIVLSGTMNQTDDLALLTVNDD